MRQDNRQVALSPNRRIVRLVESMLSFIFGFPLLDGLVGCVPPLFFVFIIGVIFDIYRFRRVKSIHKHFTGLIQDILMHELAVFDRRRVDIWPNNHLVAGETCNTRMLAFFFLYVDHFTLDIGQVYAVFLKIKLRHLETLFEELGLLHKFLLLTRFEAG